MPEDITEKIQAAQSKFEQLVAKIPGYAGYKKREQRREADKLLRLHVARKYEGQLKRLHEAQYAMTARGRLGAIMTLERASMKLQLLVDRLKTASYGYSGLFDAVKVDEEALDRLYEFDAKMLEGVDRVSTILDRLEEALNADMPNPAEANELVRELDALNDIYSQRQDVIIG